MATNRSVVVADSHVGGSSRRIPQSARIRRAVRLPFGPIYPAVGAGSLWSSSAAVWEDPATRDDRILRIDPETLRVRETVRVGGNVSAVAFGTGSVWAALPAGSVVRIDPA